MLITYWIICSDSSKYRGNLLPDKAGSRSPGAEGRAQQAEAHDDAELYPWKMECQWYIGELDLLKHHSIANGDTNHDSQSATRRD